MRPRMKQAILGSCGVIAIMALMFAYSLSPTGKTNAAAAEIAQKEAIQAQAREQGRAIVSAIGCVQDQTGACHAVAVFTRGPDVISISLEPADCGNPEVQKRLSLGIAKPLNVATFWNK